MVSTDQYSSLVTSEYSQAPRFMALVSAVCQCFVDQQNVVLSIPDKLSLDKAVGQQLDYVGQWIGLSRAIKTPITGYFFTFDDTAATGWDGGIWYLPNQPTYGTSQFDDETYRLLLKAKIAANNWNGSWAGLTAILEEIFSPATVSITDNNSMAVSITITGRPPSSLFKYLVTQGYIPLTASGVQFSYTFS
jgi:hypothetical protein